VPLEAAARAYKILNGTNLTGLTLVTPILLILLDVTDSGGANIWHDLFQVTVTVIGMLILYLVRTYLQGVKDIRKELEELKKERNSDIDKARLTYAGELALLKRRQDKQIQIIIQLAFRLPTSGTEDSTFAAQKLIKELTEE
jgi:hypothetical protein